MDYHGTGIPPEDQAKDAPYLPRPVAPLAAVPGEPVASPWSHTQHQQQTEFGTTDVPLEHANRGGAGKLGGLAGAGFLVFKVLSAGKFAMAAVFKAPLILSLLANIVVYTLVFGAQNPLLGVAFASGFVALIFVHEMGHMIAARMEGVSASVPFFIPFMGAAIFLKDHPRNARSEAIIGIGGPVLGTIAALVVLSLAGTFNPSTTLGLLFIRLAYYGFIINLFNMIPMSPLDGGRILGAVSRWFNVVGLGLILFVIVQGIFTSPILWLILALGAYGTYKRFTRPEHDGYYEVSSGTRMVIGLSYLLLLAVLIGGVVVTQSYSIAG